MKLNLTIADTNVLKGIALLLLLLHHMVYDKIGLFDDIQVYKSLYLVNELGKFGKLCVAIFVFLSGYGLTKQLDKNKYIKIGEFYKRRFSKLYLNYWFIWLIFVPIGILFFGRTFDVVYVNHIWPKFIIDLFGLSHAFGFYGYNATWWFYSCIIILYLLFPYLYMLLPKYKIVLILISLILYNSNFVLFQSFNLYLISFSLGMIMAYGINAPPPHYGILTNLFYG